MILYDRSRPPRSVVTNTSERIHRGPALIVGAIFSGTASKPRGYVYDGGNANGVLKLRLEALQYMSFSPFILDGIECLSGIYVAPDADSSYITLLYYPGSDAPDAP